jgi:hypothetical protein
MIEIRPNIFVRRRPDGRWDVSSLPAGTQLPGIPTPEEVVFKVGDLTVCTDVIEAILWESAAQVFWRGNIRSLEGEKAKQDYKQYTGEEWENEKFIKHSV